MSPHTKLMLCTLRLCDLSKVDCCLSKKFSTSFLFILISFSTVYPFIVHLVYLFCPMRNHSVSVARKSLKAAVKQKY